MASDNSELQPATYACRCLNIRITASQPPSAAPEYPRDTNYTPVYVKDDGISVVRPSAPKQKLPKIYHIHSCQIHPQVTVRVPSKAEPIPGTSRYSRFTVLTCLFCGLPVYRVHHTISLDVEGAESTLLPSEDWVEHEIMKTATGWIDVHKDCIVSGASLHLTARSGEILFLYGCVTAAKSQSNPPFRFLSHATWSYLISLHFNRLKTIFWKPKHLPTMLLFFLLLYPKLSIHFLLPRWRTTNC